MRLDQLFNARFIAAAAGMFLLSGCGSMPEVTTYRNPITGIRTDILAENLLDAGDAPARELLWLHAYRDFKNQYEYEIYLEAIYGARQEVGQLDVGPGSTLTIVADGEELNFSSLGSLEPREEDGAIFESIRYDASASDIQKIADAEEVTVRLRGRNGVVVRKFGPENHQKFEQFAERIAGAL